MVEVIKYALIFLLLGLSSWLSLIWSPVIEAMGNFTRILYFHVPCAWISCLAFAISAYYAAKYLITKDSSCTWKFHNSAELGMIYVILATVTGSIWAKVSWGSFWNWDPRETTIVILMTIYVAYFVLCSAMESAGSFNSIKAAYLLIAFLSVPFLVFIIPRLYMTLHPEPVINAYGKSDISPEIMFTLVFSLFVHTFLFIKIFVTSIRGSSAEEKFREMKLYKDA